MNRKQYPDDHDAFTLIELLLVVAIIGIMVSLVIASFTNATQDARGVVATQQQVAVQGAVNAWVAAQMADSTVGEIRATYNGASDTAGRWALVDGYLDEGTDLAISGGVLVSDVLTRTGQSITLPAWSADAGSYPQATLQ